MKTLKFLFSLLIISIIMCSCTPQALDDDPNSIENTQATGGDDSSADDGSKD